MSSQYCPSALSTQKQKCELNQEKCLWYGVCGGQQCSVWCHCETMCGAHAHYSVMYVIVQLVCSVQDIAQYCVVIPLLCDVQCASCSLIRQNGVQA